MIVTTVLHARNIWSKEHLWFLFISPCVKALPEIFRHELVRIVTVLPTAFSLPFIIIFTAFYVSTVADSFLSDFLKHCVHS